MSAVQMKLKVREIFVDVNDRFEFSNSYVRFKAQFNLFIKDSEFYLPCFSGLY